MRYILRRKKMKWENLMLEIYRQGRDVQTRPQVRRLCIRRLHQNINEKENEIKFNLKFTYQIHSQIN